MYLDSNEAAMAKKARLSHPQPDWESLGIWPFWADNRFPPYWEKLRRYVFRRDHYTCQICHRRFGAHDLDAHHILPWQNGGDDSARNLVTLCEPCHNAVHGSLIRPRSEPSTEGAVDSPPLPPTEKGPPPYDQNATAHDALFVRYVTRREEAEAKRRERARVRRARNDAQNSPAVPGGKAGKTPPALGRGPIRKWQTCKYFILLAPNHATCRRIGGPLYRDATYYKLGLATYWRKTNWGRWTYTLASGKVLIASQTCPTCGHWRKKEEPEPEEKP